MEVLVAALSTGSLCAEDVERVRAAPPFAPGDFNKLLRVLAGCVGDGALPLALACVVRCSGPVDAGAAAAFSRAASACIARASGSAEVAARALEVANAPWLPLSCALGVAASVAASAESANTLTVLVNRQDATADDLIEFAAAHAVLWQTGPLRLKNALFQALRKAVAVRAPSSRAQLTTVLLAVLDMAHRTWPAQGRECRFFLISASDLVRCCGMGDVAPALCVDMCIALHGWAWREAEAPPETHEHLRFVVNGVAKLLTNMVDHAPEAMLDALAARVPADYVAHQLLATALAHVPPPLLLARAVQITLDGVALHGPRLLDDHVAVNRLYVSLAAALMRLPLRAVEAFLFENVLVRDALASFLLGTLWACVLRRTAHPVQVAHMRMLVELHHRVAGPANQSRVARVFRVLCAHATPAVRAHIATTLPAALSLIAPARNGADDAAVVRCAAASVKEGTASLNKGGAALVGLANACRLGAAHVDPATARALALSVQEVYLRSSERRALPHLVAALADSLGTDGLRTLLMRVAQSGPRCGSPTTHMMLLLRLVPVLPSTCVDVMRPLVDAALRGAAHDWTAAFAGAYFLKTLSMARADWDPASLEALFGSHRDFLVDFLSASARPRSVCGPELVRIVGAATASALSPPPSELSTPPTQPEFGDADVATAQLLDAATRVVALAGSSQAQMAQFRARVAQALQMLANVYK